MTKDNVVDLPVVTRLDIPVEKVLKSAAERGLRSIVVIGYDEDEDFYFASSLANGPDTVWLLERAKHKLMCIVDED